MSTSFGASKGKWTGQSLLLWRSVRRLSPHQRTHRGLAPVVGKLEKKTENRKQLSVRSNRQTAFLAYEGWTEAFHYFAGNLSIC